MQPVVTTDAGALEGVSAGGVHHFNGIPYAKAARFAEPAAAPPWSGLRQAREHGPICPQPPTPLEAVLGRPPRLAEQGEDCLTLSVSTPASPVTPAARGLRPVMVWIHGGAYQIGSGSSDWYLPDALVQRGDVVVVRANYRLGVFGFLAMPGISPANFGLMDILEALRWVQRHIAAFGGDPAQVTCFGESAGAHAIATMMSTHAARGLFRRVILQSPHLGVGFTTRATAGRVARAFARALRGADPRTAPAEELLHAQRIVRVEMSRPFGLNSVPAFGPIAGEAPIGGASSLTESPSRFHGSTDVLIGTNQDEMRAYFDSNANVAMLRRVPLVGARAHDLLTAKVTERVFAAPAAKLADAQASGGAAVYRYRFDWSPPSGGFGACHTLDLPFVFGARDAWSRAPMLGGAPWEAVDVLGDAMRAAWTSFARHGDPSRDSGVPWPAHRPGDPVGRVFA